MDFSAPQKGGRVNREDHGKARAGKLTGSLVQRLMTGGYRAWNSIAREMREPRPFYGVEDSPNMPAALAWGQNNEDTAIALFWERHPEYDVENPRFVAYTGDGAQLWRDYLAVSPDRVLAVDGKPVSGVEIKCPFNGEIHVKTVRAGVVPDTCIWQVYHEMLVLEVDHWWFTSFDPRATDPEWQYFELEVRRNADRMDRMTATINRFLETFVTGEKFEPETRTAKRYAEMFN
jgi:hypothetical protein